MSDKKRRNVGFSPRDYESIAAAAQKNGVPMTQMIIHLVEHIDDFKIDWKAVRTASKELRASWAERVARVHEYQGMDPEADDEKLSTYTGYSLATVEAITHTAHKRALRYIKRNKEIDAATLSKKAAVSLKMADRVLGQYRGTKKVPLNERYLFEAI